MPTHNVPTTREKLYEDVWAKPVAQLATEYRVSVAVLTSICKREEIPMPDKEHWAGAAAKARAKRDGLAPHSLEVQLEKVSIKTPREQFHPLIAKTELAFTSLGPDESSLRACTDFPHLNLKVSLQTQQRALQIMDRLIKLLTSLDLKVALEKCGEYDRLWDEQYRTVVSVGTDRVEIYLEEKREHWSHKGPSVPRKLQIGARYPTKMKRLWEDLNATFLESSLDAAANGLALIIEDIRAKRLEKEIEEVRLQKEREREARRQEIVRNKRAEVNALETQALCWARAEAIRKYLHSLERAILGGQLRPRDEEGFTRWLNRSRELTNIMDPITGEWKDPAPAFLLPQASGFSHGDEQPRPRKPWIYIKSEKE